MGTNSAGEAKRKRAKIRKKLETIRAKKEAAAAK